MADIWCGELERKVDEHGRIAISDFPLGNHVYAKKAHIEGHDVILCYTESNFREYTELVPREGLSDFHTLSVDQNHRINFNGLAKYTPHEHVLIEGRGKYFFVVPRSQIKAPSIENK